MSKKHPTPKEYVKQDKIQLADTVRYVQTLLVQGMFTKDIITDCCKKYNVVERTVYNWIDKAYLEFKELRQKDIDSSLARHIETRWHLYKSLLEVSTNKKTKKIHKDPKVMAELRALLQDIAKLEGLYIEKIDHTTKGEKVQVYIPDNNRGATNGG